MTACCTTQALVSKITSLSPIHLTMITTKIPSTKSMAMRAQVNRRVSGTRSYRYSNLQHLMIEIQYHKGGSSKTLMVQNP